MPFSEPELRLREEFIEPWLMWLSGLVSSRKVRGHWFGSWSGCMPGLQVWSPMFLSLPLSLKINKKERRKEERKGEKSSLKSKPETPELMTPSGLPVN